jgi:hypothetical protein
MLTSGPLLTDPQTSVGSQGCLLKHCYPAIKEGHNKFRVETETAFHHSLLAVGIAGLLVRVLPLQWFADSPHLSHQHKTVAFENETAADGL